MSFGSDSPRARNFILNFSLSLHLWYETWSSAALPVTATSVLITLNSLVIPFLFHFQIIYKHALFISASLHVSLISFHSCHIPVRSAYDSLHTCTILTDPLIQSPFLYFSKDTFHQSAYTATLWKTWLWIFINHPPIHAEWQRCSNVNSHNIY
jgi:hypothetical protein